MLNLKPGDLISVKFKYLEEIAILVVIEESPSTPTLKALGATEVVAHHTEYNMPTYLVFPGPEIVDLKKLDYQKLSTYQLNKLMKFNEKYPINQILTSGQNWLRCYAINYRKYLMT